MASIKMAVFYSHLLYVTWLQLKIVRVIGGILLQMVAFELQCYVCAAVVKERNHNKLQMDSSECPPFRTGCSSAIILLFASIFTTNNFQQRL